MLKPLADRILVRVDAEETQTKGGILLPDTAQKKQQRGIVVALGTGKVLASHQDGDMPCKFGQEDAFFRCRVTAAHNKYVLAGKKLAVASSTVGNATAFVFLFTLETHLSRMCTCGQQDAKALKLSPSGTNRLDIA